MSGVNKDIVKFLIETRDGIESILKELSEKPKDVLKEAEYGISGEPNQIKRTLDAEDMSYATFEEDGKVMYRSDFDKALPFQFKEVKDSKGNIFIQIPKAYIKQGKNGVSVSCEQKEFYQLPKAFINENGKELDCFYIAKYAATNDEGIITSKPGLKHYVNRTIDQFRDLSKHEGYRLLNAYRYGYLVELFKIEFATIDSKSILKGVLNRRWDEGQLKSGQSGTKGIATGYDKKTSAFTYRGIENLFGNVWQFLDGIYADEEGIKVSHNNKNYDLFLSSGKNKNKDISGWVTGMETNENHPGLSLPFKLSDNEKESYKSYTFLDYNKNKKVCFVGGDWYAGSGAGLFCWGLGDDLGYAYFALGARLSSDTLKGGVGV